MDPIPAVEQQIALDIVRRGAYIAPLALLAGAVVAGVEGLVSVAIGLAIVAANFLVAAAIMTRAAKISPGALGGAALAGYVVRLGTIFIALFLLKDQPWINLRVLGFTIVITHLALLAWETKHLSISLAAPGLKPKASALSRED
jgi:hypothetical protein